MPDHRRPNRRPGTFVTLLVALVGLGALVLHAAPPGDAAPARQNSEVHFAMSRGWPVRVRDFLRVETSTPVYNVLYQYGSIAASPSGAYGPNVTDSPARWYVEYQRAGATDLIDGVLRGDSGLIAGGLRMFHFALARETRTGAFPGSTWPFHGTAMFLAEAAPALIVLAYSPVRLQYRAELAWQTERMDWAARHLVRVVGGVGRIDDHTKNHRLFEAALALGAVGVLAHDRRLVIWSRRYAWEGIAMARPDGVMPEDGGHDSGYQALGMVDATRYLTLVATGKLHRALFATLRRGENWEISRVRPDGTVNQAGDTRTTGCEERDPLGNCKTTLYAPIFSALARWSVIASHTRFARTAYRVWLQNWRLVPGDVLPRAGLWAMPRLVRPGSWLTVWGARFQPLEVVRVYFGAQLEQTIPCDQIGSFGAHSPEPNAHFPLPSVPPGIYKVVARGSFGTVRHFHVIVQG